MNILLTGGTGFIGSALTKALIDRGHSCVIHSRQAIANKPHCQYFQHLYDISSDMRFDAVINLAGASLAGRRWSDTYRKEIFTSRLGSTRELLSLLRRLLHKPAVLLNASAVGYYGHHQDETLAEYGTVNAGFSQSLCGQWEAVALQAETLGIRVCLLRFGVVLDKDGGALQAMSSSYQLGIANWMGHGNQWLSWIHRADAVRAVLFLLQHEELDGPFNITAPEPVTHRGFCQTMKRQKNTFLTLPLPAFLMRLIIGPMAEELLLNGQKVIPARLAAAGFNFSSATLDDALSKIYQTSTNKGSQS